MLRGARTQTHGLQTTTLDANTLTMTMNRCAFLLIALFAAGATLTACGQKEAAVPLAPAAVVITAPTAAVAASGPVTGGASDGSLPDTAAALASPGTVPGANASPPSTMTREQESKAMPLPGQANDHSTPMPAKAKGG